ncbi:adenylosuccinate lyase family protein [Streptomyces sp. DH37]|uniref:class-II fumarase/aspartase family protein n=1 Tax=Streptomyces sp. DH37 TaxID=3040122 RepID=UPI00244306C0|nr:adenylosuccinate lyase family protein [Streptomyces sp. DH37]MDG9703198.1 adenylosuccinate lyase family protein [Streptomyces sp. DH37]
MSNHSHTASRGDDCRHERGHITDSRFYGNRYSSPDSRRVFCDVCRHQRWLDIEAALAQAQAELGLIPQETADRIAATACIDLIDLDQVQLEIERSGHSLVGLLRVFEAACGPEAGQYIHYGATTQDIQDTGQVLEIRDVLDILQPQLAEITRVLADLAERHADTVALGRTHAQPALPMSFGLKVAGWTDELLRHLKRLEELRERVLVAQLFGGAGTMAGFGDQGPALLERFAHRLGLGVPTTGWHVARDRPAEFVSALAMVTGTLARIADEIRTLSRPEFAEVQEAWRPGKVGSSTMPHKRNPERCEQVVVMARLASAQVSVALAGMIGDHERDARALRVEWACIPDVSHYCLAACAMTLESVTGLIVHTDRLLSNTTDVADKVMSERLMLTLGRQVGKQRAHELVYEVTQQAQQQGLPVRALLDGHAQIAGRLTAEELDAIFDPATYLGASSALTARTVAEARKTLAVTEPL